MLIPSTLWVSQTGVDCVPFLSRSSSLQASLGCPRQTPLECRRWLDICPIEWLSTADANQFHQLQRLKINASGVLHIRLPVDMPRRQVRGVLVTQLPSLLLCSKQCDRSGRESTVKRRCFQAWPWLLDPLGIAPSTWNGPDTVESRRGAVRVRSLSPLSKSNRSRRCSVSARRAGDVRTITKRCDLLDEGMARKKMLQVSPVLYYSAPKRKNGDKNCTVQ